MATNALPNVGARIEATRMISYTLDEFEDNPLVLQPGDQGTIVSVDAKKGIADVEWDSDSRKDIKKAVSVNHGPTDFRVL